MRLLTLDVSREEAREAFLEYRRAVREPGRHRLDEAERDYLELDQAVMRGYKAIASGKQVISLRETIAAGGFVEIEGVHRNTRARVACDVPAIACVRADARTCWTRGVTRDGAASFHANDWHGWAGRRADILSLGTIFEEDHTRPSDYDRGTFRAIVPTIPPPFRPEHKLSGYHLLFEAEWDAAAPIDPALLKHLGGDLYAVLAVWDLTPLERTVLGGIRSDV